ncbi:MAG: substrate-binding domain-containing protein [Chloroflexi bacterium]|nr:substrate-binding domain-containing protein [Chloroflexota bacterium]
MTITHPKRLAALGLIAVFAVGACSSGAGTTRAPSSGPSVAPSSIGPAASPSASTATGGAPTDVSGSIAVSGSSTVEPISTGVAQALKAASPAFNYTIEGPGTGDGFKRFCADETDISDASRKIKDEEAALCTAAGIEYVELKVAIDGITIMTSPDNSAVECLSFADLYALTGPESTGFKKWSDAATIAKELGSSTTFPDADLTITGPGEESGTFDSYVELVLQKIGENERKQEDVTTRPDYVANSNDNAIIDGIDSSPNSLGWVGFAFADENKDKVKSLQIAKDVNGTCVAPTAETIADGSYPISRGLYIYVNTAKAKSNPAVAAYVDYYLAEGTISAVLEEVPYVNLPADQLSESKAAWEAAK